MTATPHAKEMLQEREDIFEFFGFQPMKSEIVNLTFFYPDSEKMESRRDEPFFEEPYFCKLIFEIDKDPLAFSVKFSVDEFDSFATWVNKNFETPVSEYKKKGLEVSLFFQRNYVGLNRNFTFYLHNFSGRRAIFSFTDMGRSEGKSDLRDYLYSYEIYQRIVFHKSLQAEK